MSFIRQGSRARVRAGSTGVGGARKLVVALTASVPSCMAGTGVRWPLRRSPRHGRSTVLLLGLVATISQGGCRRRAEPANRHSEAGEPLASSALELVYPYADTVFPRGLLPPTIMWSGAAPGENVRLSLRSRSGEIAETVVTSRGAGYAFNEKSWRAVAEAGVGDTDVEIEIARSAPATASHRIRITVADETLAGVLYFWSSSVTQMLRWRPETSTTETVFPLPAAPGPGKAPCVKCHSVSRDGSLMALSAFEAPGAATLVDTSTRVIANDIARPVYKTMFQAMHPDGKRLVANGSDELMLVDVSDPRTPHMVGNAGLPSKGAAQPTFTPSGDALVFAFHTNRPTATDFTASDLATAPFDAATDQFGAPHIIAAGEGQACAYPSVLPDGKHVVFQRGDSARSSDSAGVVRHRGELALTSLVGGSARTLGRATSAAPSARDARSAFQPAAPIAATGKHLFVAFVSLRDYGTRLVHQFRRQIWVTALDRELTSDDPSHPPFWLPGQDPGSTQMMPGWAAAPAESRDRR